MELTTIRVIIIEDHPVVRNALQRYLTSCPDIIVAGTAAACDEGLQLATTVHPDVAVVDLHLPYTGRDNPTPSVFTHGIHLISTLHQRLPDVGILVMTGLYTPVTRYAALQAGACECLSKNCETSEIGSAIRAISRGEIRERYFAGPAPMLSLTARELEILHLIGLGLTNRQIASQLTISPHTVNNHLKSLYSKLGISRRVEAAALVTSWDLPALTIPE